MHRRIYRVAVIGAGFAGLSSACFLAKAGFDVTVFEKNASPGGRARQFKSNGFTFDMGPSWYWMPDVFDSFFAAFGKQTSDYYILQRLDPSYRIIYAKDDVHDVPAGTDALIMLFEQLEPGSGKALDRFLQEGKYKYDIGMKELVYKPGVSLAELLNVNLMRGVLNLHIFQSISAYIRKFFKSPKLHQLLEFPVLFLGAAPEKTPALYSLMNYADMALGTWYPAGGMYKIIEAMMALATSLGVTFEWNSRVEQLEMNHNVASGIRVNQSFHAFDYIVASADYHHVEQHLLQPAHRVHTERYWNTRVLAPSSLIFYLGIGKKINGLLHHTLFFDEDLKRHATEIYDTPQWPSAPQFYVSCPSKTDPGVAPQGYENLFILIPVAAGLEDGAAIRDKYFELVVRRLEKLLGENLSDHIVFKRSYAHSDFITDYNAYKGNAYGLANTLRQTANLKPSVISKKVRNLFYAGQLTVPGPGVPPALISGQVAAQQLIKIHQQPDNRST